MSVICATEVSTSVYETEDRFYSVLCQKKADTFAIMGKPEVPAHSSTARQH